MRRATFPRTCFAETRRAIKAISEGKTEDAVAAIELAIGKINVLVARNPASALLPVDLEVEVIDLAPLNVKTIEALTEAASEAFDDKDYPKARVLLDQLTSEIRIRTFHLPLATYPVALREAARLLAEKKTELADDILTTALHTLVIIDRVTPLPIGLAQVAIARAQSLGKENKDKSLQLLATAKRELERARALGYAANDPEYVALNEAVSEVERQITGGQNTESAFASLKEKIASFFSRQGDKELPSSGQRIERVSRAAQ
jgi:hypothetical protein